MASDFTGGAISRRRFLRGTAGAAGLLALRPWEIATAAGASLPGQNAPFDTVVVAMMENRSFDHLLGWLPGARGRQAGLRYRDRTGRLHPTHDLGTDFTGCGKTGPDHSWYGGLIQLNHGRADGWLKTPAGRSPSDTYPIGYYTESAVPVLGALARRYTTLDGYFSSIMAETQPNRMYMHAAQTDRDHNVNPQRLGGPPKISTLPTIWDRLAEARLSGRYYFSDEPVIGLWGAKYLPISAPFTRFLADAAAGTLPNVSFVDPKFTGASGPQSDQHPFADVRSGDKFIADVYQAIRTSPQWGRTVLVVTYDEWGGFFDHVRPPRVIDHTNPAHVDHSCSCRQPRRRVPDYRQLGFRVPCVVVSPFARPGPRHGGPYEHTSILRMIEWRWGLRPLTARDQNARNLADTLDFSFTNTVPASAIPSPGPFTPQSCRSNSNGAALPGLQLPGGLKLPGFSG